MKRIRTALAAAFVAMVLAGCVNPADDMTEIRENPQGELALKTMILTLPDGEAIPVTFVREDNYVFIGADGRWWRQLRGDGAAVKVLIKGEELSGMGRAVEDDKDRARYILEKVRPGFAWLTPSVPIEIKLDE